MKKIMVWMLLAMCLLGVAQAEDITGEWKFIGWMEFGEFQEGTEYADSWTYTFEDGRRMTYYEDGQGRPGIWEEKNGVLYRGVNGRKDRMVLRADGTLLIGTWTDGMVFSRDGMLPKVKELPSGMTKDGLYYEPAGDGSLMITGHESNEIRVEYDDEGNVADPLKLVIPAQINGMAVSMVNGFAFQGNRHIVSVTIEEGVRYVGREAFSECSNVAYIVLPESLTALEGYCFNDNRKVVEVVLPHGLQDVGMNPFASCQRLEKFILPEEHLWLELTDGALISKQEKALKAFPTAAAASKYTVPGSVESINVAAFRDCVNLEYIALHDKLKEIGSHAFERSGLKKISIPASVEDMNTNPFSYCASLEKITIEDGNPAYYSVDGVLFGKEESNLLYYPMGKTDAAYTIPGTTKMVDFDAFAWQPYLRDVVIEPGVEIIQPYAFYGMSNLQSVSIPETVTRLGGYAFAQCDQLRTMEIPASVTVIEEGTFAYGVLNTLIVEEGTAISELAFENAREEAAIQYK